MNLPTVVTASVALAAYLRTKACTLETVELGEREGKPELLFSLIGMNALLYHSQWLSVKEKLPREAVAAFMNEALNLYRRTTGETRLLMEARP
jgi:hypothetical protein